MFRVHKWRCSCALERKAIRRAPHRSLRREQTLQFKPVRHSILLENKDNVLQPTGSYPSSPAPITLRLNVDNDSHPSSSLAASSDSVLESSANTTVYNGWLFNNKAAGILDLSTRKKYSHLLSVATSKLPLYDIRASNGRNPNLRKNTKLIEPCLTARQAAIEASRRRPRLESARDEELEQTVTVLLQQPGQGYSKIVDDDSWQQKLRSQHSHLSYMLQLQQQLQTQIQLRKQHLGRSISLQKIVKAELNMESEQKKDIEQQLIYQIGIMDDWVQCRNLHEVFSATDHLRGPVVAALLKRLAVLLASPKDRMGMSPAEGREFLIFTRTLADAAVPVVSELTAQHVGWVMYSLACLEMTESQELVQDLLHHSGELLIQQLELLSGAAAAGRRELEISSDVQIAGTAGSRRRSGSLKAGSNGGSPSGQGAPEALFVASDYASIMWGLGTLKQRPSPAWLDALCSCCVSRLDVFQASQLWGVLWGFARLGHVPQKVWMERWLMCAERIFREFDIEGLCHVIWSLGALRYVPEKVWLRACIGQVQSKYRSLFPQQMTQLLEGLAAIGYKPREEVCMSLQAQSRRQLHAFSAEQQAVSLRAMAMHSKWQPQRQFLYDFVTHSQPKLNSMTAFQLSSVIWSFACFKYLPDGSYTQSLVNLLTARLEESGSHSGPCLSQAVWAIATLGLKPSYRFLQVWSLKSRQSLHKFTPQCLSHTLWSMARLYNRMEDAKENIKLSRAARKSKPDVQLLEGLLLRCSQELSSFSGMEITTVISSLADLQYRPSDEWLISYVQETERRLPTLQNQDYGLTIASLSTLAAPLDARWLQVFVKEAGRKWWSMDLDGMALLLHGLAQYNFCPDSREWWAGFWQESEARWEKRGSEAAGQRTLAVLSLSLGDLLTTAPSKVWQRNLRRAIRLSFPKPRTSADIPVMLMQAAGRDEDEPISEVPWLKTFFAELATDWRFPMVLH
ncbi:hypothetical protein CEUSTIGMA_g8289.t1 [Chlamydomonas eustigma]|uniref:RAP domain-containing protein n=1 Tax=Chlamydomonas eustigma TaxID=1157962 RepID=A0A250XCR9_9CHLO|nr:hypothetical protein CEUSTIGMA_g8289.t1 [Chlamydomonas eustigma]|eukprot:GAX80854.1 hypothetical protein CEUSTIGMA_g8289.t1 [Chlamydomonas eustigma]